VRVGGKLIGVFQEYSKLSSNIIDVDGSETYMGKKNSIDYKSDATRLKFIKSHTLDFVCCSHLLEHISNPIKAINEWKRVLKKEGMIYCAVPDKRFTFDHNRKITPLKHLIKDYKKDVIPEDDTHVREFLTNWDEDMDGLNKENFYNLVNENYAINVHHHVWTKKELIEFFEYVGLDILLSKQRGNTLHFVLRKVE
jgi:predicted SAM-dependent methyltransferase